MYKKIIVVLITLFMSISGFSQISNTSVYSFFGIGDENNSGTTEQLSMGGVGVALGEAQRINFSNPAANSSLNFTNYALGLVSKNVWVEQNGNTQNAVATYISYLAMGFNIGDKGGLSFGLLPNTSVGYNLFSADYNDDNEIVNVTYYEGEGGTSRVFLGIGYEVAKGLSIGGQVDYIFGKVKNRIVNQIKDVTLATKYETVSNISGFKFNAGFQYKTKIGDYLSLMAGGNLILENEIKSNEKEYLYSTLLNTVGGNRDTILNNENTAYLKSPLKTALGLGVGRDNKWYAGVDYTFQGAQSFVGSVYDVPSASHTNYSKIAVGGFYTPKYNSILSYWNRVTYRAGFKYENSGLMIDGDNDGADFNEIDDFGISFGIGLPVGKQLSNLNFGFEFGRRGTVEQNLVKEDYFNFRLSISLNDKWFKKQQIY